MSDKIPPELQNNKSLCVLPWIHASTKPNGEIKPCCRFAHYLDEHTDIKAMNVHEYTTAEQILNSKPFQDLREKMLRSETIPGCIKCYQEEERQGDTMRIGEWKKYPSKEIIETNDLKLRYLEVAFGNYCNLACRTCNSDLSTNWYEDDLQLQQTGRFKDRRVFKKITDVDYNWSAEDLDKLEQVKFTGGEPMLHPNFTKFLDIMIDADLAKNISLEIFTNCSWVPKDKVKKRLDKFKNVYIWLSIDGSGKVNDYIRHKSEWDTVYDSMIEWLDYEVENKDSMVILTPTASIYNMFNLHELVDMFVLERYNRKLPISKDNLVINLAYFPKYISFENVMDKEKAIEWVEEEYNKYNKKFSNIDNEEFSYRDNYAKKVVAKIVNELKNVEVKIDDNFIFYIKSLDKIRNQSLQESIPRLYEYIEECAWENYGK